MNQLRHTVTLLGMTVTTLVTSVASAHPGHGETSANEVNHYFVEPIHMVSCAAVMIAFVTVTVAAHSLLKQRRSLKQHAFQQLKHCTAKSFNE